MLINNDKELNQQRDRVKFRCSINDEQFEEILSYNEIINHIEQDETETGIWKINSISGHQGPLSKSDTNYNGSRYNVLVNWETGESIYEPFHIIAADDPVTCEIYTNENNLLEEEGWKRFKRIAKRQQGLDSPIKPSFSLSESNLFICMVTLYQGTMNKQWPLMRKMATPSGETQNSWKLINCMTIISSRILVRIHQHHQDTRKLEYIWFMQ